MVSAASSARVSARWLVGVIASVVLCFVLATVVVQYQERVITGRADLIVSNAMPSVQFLTTARGDVHALGRQLERYAAAGADERPLLLESIVAKRTDAVAELAAYQVLPMFGDEPPLYAPVQQALDGLDRDLANLANPGAVAVMQHDLDRIDHALERVINFDAAEGQRLGREIERTRGDTRGIAIVLSVVSVALAVLAAALALRQLRRASRADEHLRALNDKHTAELAERAEALGQFAGRVAHDILSPLQAASIALDCGRLVNTEDPALQRTLDRGTAAVQRVRALVTGLLEFSSAGGHPPPGTKTEVSGLVTDLLEALTEEARQARIVLEGERIAPCDLACSAGVLTSLVANLVRNAIKYMGDANERRIVVRGIDLGDRLRIEVEDSGPGVPAELQRRIFEPHVQLAPTSAGIGLGLATVDRLARAHGGEAGVTSPAARNRGSRFWFEMPKVATSVSVPVAMPQFST